MLLKMSQWKKKKKKLAAKESFFYFHRGLCFCEWRPTNQRPLFYGQRRWSRKSSGCRLRIPAVLRRGSRPTRAPDELLIGELSLVCFSSVCSGPCPTKKIELDGVKLHQKRIWVIGLSLIEACWWVENGVRLHCCVIFFLISFYLFGVSTGFPNLFEVSESDWGP